MHFWGSAANRGEYAGRLAEKLLWLKVEEAAGTMEAGAYVMVSE